MSSILAKLLDNFKICVLTIYRCLCIILPMDTIQIVEREEKIMPGAIRNHLSEIMGRHRMSISELARKTGLSYQGLWSIYHDKTSRIDFDTIARVCDVLGVTVGELFVYEPPDNKERP